MTKIFVIFIFAVLLSTQAEADCIKHYKRYKRSVFFSPVSTPISSSANSTVGGLSSVGAAGLGTTVLNEELSTAGFLYGAAFFYEGQYVFENTITNVKLYRSRARALKILKEARRGFGDHLEEYLDELNELVFTGDFLELDQLTTILKDGNRDGTFCPEGKTLYTLKNISDFILNSISE